MPQAVVIFALNAAAIASTAFIAGTAITLAAVLAQAAILTGLALIAAKIFAPDDPDVNVGITGANRGTLRAATTPVRWVVGRARIGGLLAYYKEVEQEITYQETKTRRVGGGRGEGPATYETYVVNRTRIEEYVTAAFVISEGACEGIEKMWADGEEITYTRTELMNNAGWKLTGTGDYADKFVAYEYFSGDGTQGSAFRALTDDNTPTNEHSLPAEAVFMGLSWIGVQLTQPSYGNNLDDRFWTRFPGLQVQMKGIKITWPGQATPTWTDNAAALRYWWLRNRRAIPSANIDEASVRAAYSLCEETVSVVLTSAFSDYSPTSKRYSINGLIQANDGVAGVEREMDFAWQGHAVEIDGTFVFRPGAERAATATIEPDDIISVEGIQPAPALQDRINAASVSIAQSSEHEWTQLDLPEYNDTEAQTRDGEKLPANLGALAFVAEPIAAGRILAIALRRARASATYSYRLKPGAGMKWLALLPTDIVHLNDFENGFQSTRAQVVSTSVNSDWSVSVALVESPTGIYADALVLPPLKPREIAYPARRTAPGAPKGVVSSATARTAPDGTITNSLLIYWSPAPVQSTELRWRFQGQIDGDWNYLSTGGAQLSIEGLLINDTYEYQIRHTNIHGLHSDWTATATYTLTGDLTPPGAVTGLTATPAPGGYLLEWNAPGDADWHYTEIKDAPGTSTSVDDAATATERARISGTTWTRGLVAGSPTAVSIFVRHVDRSGNGGAFALVTATTLAESGRGDDGADGAPGQRGAGIYSVASSVTAWSSVVAVTALPDNTPVPSDVVTIINIADAFKETRFWNGSAWIAATQRIDGALLIHGSISAQHAAFESLAALNLKVRNADIEGTISANKLNVQTAQIFDSIQSDNYVAGSAGFKLSKAGLADFNGVIRGSQIENSGGVIKRILVSSGDAADPSKLLTNLNITESNSTLNVEISSIEFEDAAGLLISDLQSATEANASEISILSGTVSALEAQIGDLQSQIDSHEH